MAHQLPPWRRGHHKDGGINNAQLLRHGKVITNRGGGALAITLPAPTTVPVGSWVMIYSVAAGDVSITCTDKIICLNNAAADAIGWTTAGEEIGNCARMVSLGSLWFAEMHIADEANTMTVTSA
jgi:hypothetical protein